MIGEQCQALPLAYAGSIHTAATDRLTDAVSAAHAPPLNESSFEDDEPITALNTSVSRSPSTSQPRRFQPYHRYTSGGNTPAQVGVLLHDVGVPMLIHIRKQSLPTERCE